MPSIIYNRASESDVKLNKIIVPLHCFCPASNGTITSNIPTSCVYTKEPHPDTNSVLYSNTGVAKTTYSITGYNATYTSQIIVSYPDPNSSTTK